MRFKCQACGHEWISGSEPGPGECPVCHSLRAERVRHLEEVQSGLDYDFTPHNEEDPLAEVSGAASLEMKVVPPWDSSNRFGVVPVWRELGRPPVRVKLGIAICGQLDRDAALNLAAWLSVMADPIGEDFGRLVKAIRER